MGYNLYKPNGIFKIFLQIEICRKILIEQIFKKRKFSNLVNYLFAIPRIACYTKNTKECNRGGLREQSNKDIIIPKSDLYFK